MHPAALSNLTPEFILAFVTSGLLNNFASVTDFETQAEKPVSIINDATSFRAGPAPERHAPAAPATAPSRMALNPLVNIWQLKMFPPPRAEACCAKRFRFPAGARSRGSPEGTRISGTDGPVKSNLYEVTGCLSPAADMANRLGSNLNRGSCSQA